MILQESIRIEPYGGEPAPLAHQILRKTWIHSRATRLLSAALLEAGMLDLAEDTACETTASTAEARDVAPYVALTDGVYRFERRARVLERIVPGDFRPLCTPESAAHAVVFLHVGESGHPATTTLAAQLYLLASSQGLACWPHECDRGGLAGPLGLVDPSQLLFAQTVRFPASWDTSVQAGD